MTIKRLKPSKSQQGPYSVEQVRVIMEDMIERLNQKKFYSEESIELKAAERLDTVFENQHGNKEKVKAYLESQFTIADEAVKESKNGLIESLEEISNLFDIQINFARYYDAFVDNYNELAILRTMNTMLKKKKIAGKGRRVKQKKIWDKSKKDAAIHIVQLYNKHNGNIKALILCKEFLNEYVIKNAENYTPKQLLTFYSRIKSNNSDADRSFSPYTDHTPKVKKYDY